MNTVFAFAVSLDGDSKRWLIDMKSSPPTVKLSDAKVPRKREGEWKEWI